ncbi:hypothetical protein Tco_1396679, partial [Tanacetum coccineum]
VILLRRFKRPYYRSYCDDATTLQSIRQENLAVEMQNQGNNSAMVGGNQANRRNGLEVPWERYEEVLKTFGAVEDPMAHLKNLRQDGTIKNTTARITSSSANKGSKQLKVMAALDGEEEELTQEECLVEEGNSIVQ